MLNPAVHFRHVVEQARAVLLLGGTMAPVRARACNRCCGCVGSARCVRCVTDAARVAGGGDDAAAVPVRTSPARAQPHAGARCAAGEPAGRWARWRLLTAPLGRAPSHARATTRAVTVPSGPAGVRFNFSFRHRADGAQLAELGQLLANLSRVVPAGMVCFLPSFDFMATALTAWEASGALALLRKHKAVRA